ncbi:MAG TPA: divalent metal cation transporter [Nitrososphaeraceae archaeon]|nr:divalent metal cation transporter [Nitrososphaeraceae archaeon]
MTEDIKKKDQSGNKNRKDNSRVRHNPKMHSNQLSPKLLLKSLGPGLVTGASDDDPSGIATFSQAGARFGFGMLWLVLFQYPLMTAIQEMCARIGLVTGRGLAAVIKEKYSRKVVFPLIGLLFIANTINIGTDIGAMSASTRLLIPQVPFFVATITFAVFILLAQILIPYKKYVKVLKYLTLSLFAYFITAVIVGGNWNEILVASILPYIEFTPEFAMMLVAIFGTSISPYLFFWQASEEAEEDVAKHKIKEISSENNHNKEPKIAKKEVKLMRFDIAIGIAFSHFIMWAIMLTSAGSLYSNGVTDIQSADQAAKALEPLVKSFPNAGQISKAVFALGIIGIGLLAVPVLAGSAGYALADGFGWKQGLSEKLKNAKAFYVVIALSTLAGLSINLINIDLIQALVYAAVINGIVAVPILIAIIKIANDKKILHGKTNGKISNIVGIITILVMSISVVIMFVTWGK